MTYVAHITLPVAFQAYNDDAARALVAQLRDMLASVPVTEWLPSVTVEVSDYPDATLQDILPYELPRVVDIDATPDCDEGCQATHALADWDAE